MHGTISYMARRWKGEQLVGLCAASLVDVARSVVGANTWSISQPNSWIGKGSGEYKLKSVIDRVLTRVVCFDAGNPRIELLMQRYPGDFSEDNSKPSGGGAYQSPYAPGKTFSLRWYSYGSIRPEPCEEAIMDEN